VDDCSGAGTITFTLLFWQVEGGDVLEDLLENELDLVAGEAGDDVCEVLDGFRLHCVVFRLDLFHEGLLDGLGDLGVGFQVDLSCQDYF
jgi:hypothetical protein